MIGRVATLVARTQLTRGRLIALVAIGGFGFASGQLLKLLGIWTGWQTNWHSIFEQTYGLINGVGLAIALFWVVRRIPKLNDEPAVRPWTESYAAGFLVLN